MSCGPLSEMIPGPISAKNRGCGRGSASGGTGVVGSYDLALDGKPIAAIMPSPGKYDKFRDHVTFLINFFDEIRRRTQKLDLRAL